MTNRRVAGSVRRRDSGRWQARIRDPMSGRLVGLGTFATKGAADKALALALADQTRGGWVDPARGRVTLADYANSWLEDRRLRPRTQELYEGLVRLHIVPALGELELGKLTPSIIRRWHSRMIDVQSVGESTAAKAYRLLHAILATATVDELLARNPCVVKGAGTEHAPERPVISVADVWAFADIVAPRFRTLVLMAAFLGLRRGELFGLTRSRIDLLHNTVTVVDQRQQLKDGTVFTGKPKTEAGRRTISIPVQLIPEIEAHLAHFAQPGPDGLVFCGERGGPLRNHVWQAKWAKARAQMGMPELHFHDLRHVANTLTAASGASTKELMHRMGHASPEAALRYQHATRDRDAAIAAVLGTLLDRQPATVVELRPDAQGAGEGSRDS